MLIITVLARLSPPSLALPPSLPLPCLRRRSVAPLPYPCRPVRPPAAPLSLSGANYSSVLRGRKGRDVRPCGAPLRPLAFLLSNGAPPVRLSYTVRRRPPFLPPVGRAAVGAGCGQSACLLVFRRACLLLRSNYLRR